MHFIIVNHWLICQLQVNNDLALLRNTYQNVVQKQK